MSARAMTANTVPAGLLLLALGVPCAFAAAADAPQAGAAAVAPQGGAGAAALQAAAAAEKKPPEMSPEAKILGDPKHPDPPPECSFSPGTYEDTEDKCRDAQAAQAAKAARDKPYDAQAQLDIYGAKHMNKTANPPIQEGIRIYDRGAYEPTPTLLGAKNPNAFAFRAYGDLRFGAADNDNGVAAANGKTDQSRVATRLNLDLDLNFTATERIHAFMRPFDQNGSFTRYEISGGVKDKFVQELNSKVGTLFFEGDLGNMLAGIRGKPSSFDIPIAVGLVPVATQNGIWIEDAFTGGAIAVTAKNSKALDISNFDVTAFTGLDRVTTDAVPAGHGKAKLFALAGFADLLKGYGEAGYGYVEADDKDLSYHNVTAAFTTRPAGGYVSTSLRLIGNFGQKAAVKTANGLLVLVESSLISPKPLVLVPYLNLFAGFDTPQSLARAADAGGVLRNTGINFQTDGLTGYPTLDAKGHDTYGGALGVEYLFNLERQIVVEGAVVERMNNNATVSGLPGAEYALGATYQQPISNAWIFRVDAMRGWRQGQRDIFGARAELRLKF